MVVEWNKQGSFGINKALQTSESWCKLVAESHLIESTLKSLGFAAGFIFLVLIVVTGNIVITLLSMLTLAITAVHAAASVSLAGWKLGPGDSAAAVVCLGLAASYLVIWSDRYSRCSHLDRNNRTL